MTTLQEDAPTRVWYATGKFTADGTKLYASREWMPGEKNEYRRAALGWTDETFVARREVKAA